MLNPGVWRDLFEMILPDETDGSSSDDAELREYLNMSPTQKQQKRQLQEEMDEAALLCSEPMFEEPEETD